MAATFHQKNSKNKWEILLFSLRFTFLETENL
jgi:hypothetical protein